MSEQHIINLIKKIDDIWDYDVIHPRSCFITTESLFGVDVISYDCDVEAHLNAVGLEAFSDPLPDVPGSYLIEAWCTRCSNHVVGEDCESGIRVIGPA